MDVLCTNVGQNVAEIYPFFDFLRWRTSAIFDGFVVRLLRITHEE